MAKVSKNAKTNRQAQEGSKDYVKVIKTMKSDKSGAYTFLEKIVHKDKVKEFLANSQNVSMYNKKASQYEELFLFNFVSIIEL